MSAADKNANRQRALNVRNSLFNGATLIFCLRGNARILACIHNGGIAKPSQNCELKSCGASHQFKPLFGAKTPIHRHFPQIEKWKWLLIFSGKCEKSAHRFGPDGSLVLARPAW
jgi:hypothetical protein